MFFKPLSGSIEYLIVGLGNPGRQYENTRHNTGFLCLDYIAGELGVKVNRVKFKSAVGEATVAGRRCLLMKPSTFMNLSGQAVTEAMRFYKIPPERVILLFDDVSLDVGMMRIRRKGSDGGQNGVKNIIYLSGSDAFPRVKVGIGHKPHPDYDLKDWVLSRYTPQEAKQLSELMPNVKDAVELIVKGDIDEAMNRYN